MIRINSFLQRSTLAEIIGRWMVDRLEPTDVRRLKELIAYNGHLARIVLDELALELFEKIGGRPVVSRPVTRKGVLKDFLADHPPYTNARIEEMIRRYHEAPEHFYRETPFDGRIYLAHDGDSSLVLGTARRKRFKRVAEKVSRRIIDFVFDRIESEAEAIARERARGLGVPVDRVATAAEARKEELEHAEQRVVASLRDGTFLDGTAPLDINDVFGIKALCEDSDVPGLTELLRKNPRMEILEYELHSGAYNALNIALCYRIDKESLLAKPPTGPVLEKFAKRGLTPGEVADGYSRFLREGEDDLVIELIITSYQEGLESEIGRSMHEERILSQRHDRHYRGSLARNIAALLEFMLALRRFPGDRIDEIPIKLWIRYMPDYFEAVMKEMYGVKQSVFLAC